MDMDAMMDMDGRSFPSRLYSKGDEPEPGKSIHYYAGNTQLFESLESVLRKDEWDELLSSPLGVVLRFHALKFGWASRMVHYILTAQLECKKPHEIWSLIGNKPLRFSLLEFEEITGLNCRDVPNLDNPETEITEETRQFWTLLGVDVERGPTVNELIEACGLCAEWTRLDRIRLGYLCIYAGYIEAKKETTPINVNLARLVMDITAFQNYPWGRVALKLLIKSVKEKDLAKLSYTLEGFVHVLQIWVYYSLPDYAAQYGGPFPHKPTPPLLAFKGSRGKRYMKENMYKQVNVLSCVMKDEYEDMFPRWEDDVYDQKIINIISAISEPGWRWTHDHWQVTGVIDSANDTRKQGVKLRVKPGVKNERSMSLSLVSVPAKRSREEFESGYTAELPSLVQSIQAHFDQHFKDLSEKVDAGFKRCENNIKLLCDKVNNIEERLERIEAVKEGKEEAVKTGKEEQTKSNQIAPALHVGVSNEPAADENKTVPDIGSKMFNKETFQDGQSASVTGASPSVMIPPPQKPQPNLPLQKAKQEEKKAAKETIKDDGQSASVTCADKSLMILPPQNLPANYADIVKSKQEEKKQAVLKRTRSDRVRKPGMANKSPYENKLVKSKVGKGYDPFGPFDEQLTKKLDVWLKQQP